MNMKIAVIETGGKQYLVSEGQKIEVEKLLGEAGGKFDFDKVLLTAELNVDNGAKKNAEVEIGKPYLSGKAVGAEVIGQNRRDKVTIFKYHNKTRYRVKKGHRQPVTMVRILEI